MRDFVTRKARPEIFSLKPYVPGKPIEEVRRELGIKDIIKLASNENPLGTSPKAREAISEALGQMHHYPDANCFELKKRLAEVHKISESSIVVGNGSDEILMLLAMAFLSSGDGIIYAKPSFAEYEFTARIMGAECVEIPLKDFTHDLEKILTAVTPRTKMVFICNPNNPTGTIVDAGAMQSFMDRISEDVLVVFDEAYQEYVENPNFLSGLKYVKADRNAIVLRTFSKIYGLAGLRIGYGFTTPEIAQALEMITEPFNVNLLAQVGALAAIDDIRHVEESRRVNSQGKEYLYEMFNEMGLAYVPTESNFIFLDSGRDCQAVFKALLRLGIIVRTGDTFGYPTFIRVTVGTRQENERFINGLKKVLAEQE
ncbi:MAG: histidinol-phosphate transaminase [Syntrophomonadaceae bacterium]|nr:histidinol-phosphate transaminase [Syntrophomonadaceae bacterium]